MSRHDIMIIGGGPGGLSTALHLARDYPDLTTRIMILEKARYPRVKLCAGGLIVDAEVILQRLGLDVSEVPHADADRIHFDFEGKGLILRTPKRHTLRVIRRDEFDHWLARKAKNRGIEIREGVSVRNIVPDPNGVTVETDQGYFRAQVVVGADGSNGVTRRCIFPKLSMHTARVLEVLTPVTPAQRPGVSVAIEPRSRDTSQVARNNIPRDGAYFDFSPIPENIAGYVWDFPTQVNGNPMRCWGVYDTNILADEKRPQLKEPLAREMLRLGFDLRDYEIKGYPIRWFSPDNQMAVPRVLLVGDAAGADPFLGEGISVALGYGMLAAREVGEAFQRNEFAFQGYRRRVLTSSLGQALIARWLVAHIVYPLKWRWFQIFLWRLFKPVVLLLAWLFILNWGKRMPSTL